MRGILTGGGATGQWRGIAMVVVAIFVWSFGGALSHARTSSALRVEVSDAPQRVQGSDGREHLEYDLVITNAFTAEATLRSLQVRGDRRRVLSLSGAALEAATLRVGTKAPTRGRIEPGSTVVIQVDVVLPMIYPSHFARGTYRLRNPNAHPYKTIDNALKDAVERTKPVANAAKIIPWYQDFTLGAPHYYAAQVRAQKKAGYDNGFQSWILWNPKSNYTLAALEPQP